MKSSTDEQAIEKAPVPKVSSRRGVLCAKCNYLNENGCSSCKLCEARLFISCNDCGHRNQRVHTRCASCGRKLHRGLFAKLKKKLGLKAGQLTPLQILLSIVGIGLCFALVVAISYIDLPF